MRAVVPINKRGHNSSYLLKKGIHMIEIVFDHVTKVFQNEIALEDVSFEIEQGEFVFVTGKSGAGKSTLLHLLMKQEEVTSGHITACGKRVDLLKKNKIPYYRRKIGIMSPDIGMLGDRTVYDNIKLALMAAGKDDRKMKRRILQSLGLVGIAGKADALPNELSGGEKARALLARALSTEPQVILADEPTANLDPDTSWDLMQLLNEVNYRGITILVASHARDLVTIMKKRNITLVAGMVAADEKNAIYNPIATDVFEERRIREKRKNDKNCNF